MLISLHLRQKQSTWYSFNKSNIAVNIFYLYDGHCKAKTAAHGFDSMQMFQQWHGH